MNLETWREIASLTKMCPCTFINHHVDLSRVHAGSATKANTRIPAGFFQRTLLLRDACCLTLWSLPDRSRR